MDAPDTDGRSGTPCRDGLHDVRGALLGLVPVSLVIGALIGRCGLGTGAGLSSTLGVFSGAGEVTALTLISAGGGPLAVAGAVALSNARLALYGAVLAPHFRHQPWWFRWLAPHVLTDLTYAVTNARPRPGGRYIRRYWSTVGAATAVVWVGGHAAGMLLGPMMPPGHTPLEIATPAMFLGLLVPQLRCRPAVVAAVAGAVTATATLALVPGLALLAGGVVGLAAGALSEPTEPTEPSEPSEPGRATATDDVDRAAP